MNSKSVVLIGMAGVGKSEVGRVLAGSLGSGFIDLDDYIREMDSEKLEQVIADKDEKGLLELEEKRMYEIDLSNRLVVSPGGSIIHIPRLMDYLKAQMKKRLL